jgi:hypothetical protein
MKQQIKDKGAIQKTIDELCTPNGISIRGISNTKKQPKDEPSALSINQNFKYGDKVKDLSGIEGTVIPSELNEFCIVRVAFAPDGKGNWRDLNANQLTLSINGDEKFTGRTLQLSHEQIDLLISCLYIASSEYEKQHLELIKKFGVKEKDQAKYWFDKSTKIQDLADDIKNGEYDI